MKTLRLNTFAAIALAFFTLSSCDKVEEITQRDVEITGDGITFTIPVTQAGEGSISESINVNMELDKLIKANAPSFSVSNIKSIHLSSVKIDLLNPDDANNFKVVDNLSAKIKASGLSQQTLATFVNNNINETKNSIVLPVTGGNIELKDYLKAQSFTYSLSGKTNHATTKELQAKLTATYTFTLGL